MSKQIKEIKQYLEYTYTGARKIGTVEDCLRISRAIAALEADTEEEIFTEEFKKKYYCGDYKEE